MLDNLNIRWRNRAASTAKEERELRKQKDQRNATSPDPFHNCNHPESLQQPAGGLLHQ